MAGSHPAMTGDLRASAADRAFGTHIHRVERLARGHKEPVATAPAKAQIGAALGQRDAADHLAIGCENGHPVQLARAPAAPEIAVDIAAKAVRRAFADVAEGPTIGELCPILDDVIDADRARP